MKKKRLEFNVILSKKDREVIDELKSYGINVSASFRIFIRKHLQKVKEAHDD